MSYDISIRNRKTGEIAELKERNLHKGGTYCVGGTDTADFNITYNYCDLLCKSLETDKSVRCLYGEEVKSTLPRIEKAIEYFGDAEPTEDYWSDSPGNVKKCLMALKDIAERAIMDNPGVELVWEGD